jgi:ABC-type uncharacterized transport system permease subunit
VSARTVSRVFWALTAAGLLAGAGLVAVLGVHAVVPALAMLPAVGWAGVAALSRLWAARRQGGGQP